MRLVGSVPRDLLILAMASVGAIAFFSCAEAAQPPRLNGDDIKKMVSGATVHLHGPMGTTVPVLFRQDGTLAGRAGMASFFLGASRDSGRWWIADSKLCKKWKVWFKGRANCLEIRRKGMKFHWRDGKGESGTATIASRPVVAKTKVVEKKFTPVDPPIGLGVKKAPPRIKRAKAPAAAQPKPMAASILNKDAASNSANAGTTSRVAAAAAPSQTVSRQSAPVTATWADTDPANTYRVVGVPFGEFLNVRRAPSRTATLIGRVPPGASGIVFAGGCQRNWCPVNHPRGRGWVDKTYLRAHGEPDDMPAPPAEADAAPPPPPSAVTQAVGTGRYAPLPTLSDQLRYRVVRVRAGDVLNMRQGPSAETAIRAKIAPGARGIKVTSPCSGVWCPVSYRGQNGWVNRSYIAPVKRTSGLAQ